ncbi:MAG: hypothetical protein CMP62_05015 [Flavobacteriales bacterium]|nr:hypothetical protein [Flavobacteriales bacterium]|tara:strand:- start:3038 stop:4606 length:1569 start_codon:yes stop_codon:yes gene_type:complete
MKSVIFSTLIVLLFFSCKKENFLSTQDNLLSFSTDTLLFDTVFTTVGSATRYLKVYNNDNVDIVINSVSLNKKSNSSFKINIDGEPNHTVENILLRSNDSLYIFSEVTIDPNNLNTPFIETDSIVFTYNNQIQYVTLTAWGRNAYFHSGIPDYQQYSPQSNNLSSMLYCDFLNLTESECTESQLNGESFSYYSINTNTIWANDKPHVIYGDVIIENEAKLEIEKGSSIHLHNNSWLVVSSGSSIEAIGGNNTEELIWIQSDRSDNPYGLTVTDYSNMPGQWGKIWLMSGSINNQFEYAIIKNGKIGIQVDGVNDIENLSETPNLTIKNSIIYNMSQTGILAQGSNVYGENVQINNCGEHLLLLNIGGIYDFKHCTFANFWPFSRQTPSIVLNNYYEDINGTIQNRNLLKADFGNCIIDGNNETEILFLKSDEATFNYHIDHCIVKSSQEYITNWQENISSGSIIINSNENNIFEDLENIPLQLDDESIAIDAGSSIIANDVPKDFYGNSRLPDPDIGCLEKQ